MLCFRLIIGPITHLATGTAFGAFGYVVYEWEKRQNVLIEQKHRELKERRSARAGVEENASEEGDAATAEA